jgi:glycerol dehydrogenase
MPLILGNPGKYIQGYGELNNIFKYSKTLGQKQFVIISATGRKRFEAIFSDSRISYGGNLEYALFNGECSQRGIHRLTEEFKASGCDIVVGVGGGKAIDTAKAVADLTHSPLIIVPTSAATDAPCLAVSVIYNDDGVFESFMEHPSHPDIVLVDSKIISKAPARLFASGMGDGLSTFFEAPACGRSQVDNGVGGKQTQTAMKLSELCFDLIMNDGIKAYRAVASGLVTKSVDNVIEANIYLSGIGAEGSGDAGAHGIHNALTVLKETRGCYHGELVTFGILVQMVLENESLEFINRILEFCTTINLPVTLKDIGIDRADEGKLRLVAEAASKDSLVNMPFDVTLVDIYSAILAADTLAQEFKERNNSTGSI